jgi:hypothetical protein
MSYDIAIKENTMTITTRCNKKRHCCTHQNCTLYRRVNSSLHKVTRKLRFAFLSDLQWPQAQVLGFRNTCTRHKHWTWKDMNFLCIYIRGHETDPLPHVSNKHHLKKTWFVISPHVLYPLKFDPISVCSSLL